MFDSNSLKLVLTITSMSIQTDLKKLLRNPPMVKVPKVSDLIRGNPLLGALPAAVRDKLAGSTKETVKLHDSTLYKEGQKPNGVWLISNGVVKVIVTFDYKLIGRWLLLLRL